jgi:lysyl-tRNA synthetase, class II
MEETSTVLPVEKTPEKKESTEITVRKEKLAKITALGVTVYPESFSKKQKISDLALFSDTNFRPIEEVIPAPVLQISTAGRVVLFRSFWKIAFAHLQDDSGRIQIMFSKENCAIVVWNEIKESLSIPEVVDSEMTAFKFVEKMIDLGDMIGIEGELFRTHKGELTVFVKQFTFLGKALRPLPEKFHGIADDELKYRQRYLDLITDDSVMKRFRFRSEFIRTLREFYWKEGFMEIEGQVLTNAATGAASKPYITHQNAFDMDVFLRISHEIPLKLMNIAGMDKIFELGKAFRNEGQDPSHLPEHLHLEHNVNYWTFRDNITFTEKMFDYLFDTLKLERKRQILNKANELVDVDFSTPWAKVDYIELVKKDTGIDVSVYDDVVKLRADIRAQGIEIEGMDAMGLTTLIDYLYKKMSRPKIINPTFLYNYPVVLKPFARRNDTNPHQADAFQLVINGWELVNSYSELVDPIDQAARFAAGEKACAEGDEEAMTGDADFVRAMEYGMPPISGWGMGVDRIVALLTEQNNLRDVILFPLMRPKVEE